MATSALQQQPITFNDAPTEPFLNKETPKRRDVSGVFHYVDPSVTVEDLNADKDFGLVSSHFHIGPSTY
jgi:hypothetical protein